MNEWISVKERLPEKEITVLACNNKKNLVVTAHLSTDFMHHGKETWDSVSEYRIEEMVNEVTHWMPLPKPPKEE